MSYNQRDPIDNKDDNISWKQELRSLFLVLIFALMVRTFIFELFYVPTGSMKATILEGDYIYSTKYDYGYSKYSIPFSPDLFSDRIISSSPERGDVVIMRPPHNMNDRYVKRLLGLPGEKIQIIDDLLYINDKPIERTEIGVYVDEKGNEFKKFRETLPNGCSYFAYKMKNLPKDWQAERLSNFGPYIVEPGRYFFLGDNRDNSGDSRYQLGTVPFENLIAKGRFVIFSAATPLWDSEAEIISQIKRIFTWAASIRFSRVFVSLYEKQEEKNQAK